MDSCDWLNHSDWLNCLVKNKEWILSGLGLAVVATIWQFGRWLFTKHRLPSTITDSGIIDITIQDPLAVKALEALEKRLAVADLQAQEYQDQIKALTASITALAQQKDQPDASPGIKEALKKLAEGNTQEAEAIFQTITDRKKADIQEAAAAYRHLGALAFLHDTQKALDAYRRATQLDPQNIEGWNQLGHLLKRTGQLEKAEAAYQRVLALSEKRNDQSWIAAAYGNLGILYQIRGELAQAEAMYQKSLALNEALGRKEGMANQYGNLGILYQIRGELAQAEAMYQKSLALFREIGAEPQIKQVQEALEALR